MNFSNGEYSYHKTNLLEPLVNFAITKSYIYHMYSRDDKGSTILYKTYLYK